MLASNVSIRITTAGVELSIGGDPILDENSVDHSLHSAPQVSALAAVRFEKLDGNFQPVGREAQSWAYVRDNTTGLIWTAENVTKKAVGWEKAEKACLELDRGFRLPTRVELLTLVDDTKHDPCIDTAFFCGVESAWYWTSTPAAWSAECAWVVLFSLGDADFSLRSYGGFVRAVRSAVPAGQ